jgi:hypothetical protein
MSVVDHGVAGSGRTLPARLMSGQESRAGFHPRRLELVASAAVVFLLVWMIILASTLPGTTVTHGWAAAWVGLDCAEAFGLAMTGYALARSSRLIIPAGLMTGTLLVCDAWFDVVLTWQTSTWTISLVAAVAVELPLAGRLWWTAMQGVRGGAAAMTRREAPTRR